MSRLYFRFSVRPGQLLAADPTGMMSCGIRILRAFAFCFFSPLVSLPLLGLTSLLCLDHLHPVFSFFFLLIIASLKACCVILSSFSAS